MYYLHILYIVSSMHQIQIIFQLFLLHKWTNLARYVIENPEWLFEKTTSLWYQIAHGEKSCCSLHEWSSFLTSEDNF